MRAPLQGERETGVGAMLAFLSSLVASRRRRRNYDEDVLRTLARIAASLERLENALRSQTGGETTSSSTRHTSGEPAVFDVAEIEAESGAFFNDPSLLVAELERRGFHVVELAEDGRSCEPIDALAMKIGANFHLMEPIILELKRALQEGRSVRKRLDGYSGSEIARILEVTREMHRLALLSTCEYQSSPRYVLTVHANPGPLATEFINGYWLERYVRMVTADALIRRCARLPVSLATNVKAVGRSGTAHEFDLMFVCGDTLFWVEAKTGDYQTCIEKYATLRKSLGMEPEKAICVVAGIDAMIARNLSEIWELTVVPVGEYAHCIDELLEAHGRASALRDEPTSYLCATRA